MRLFDPANSGAFNSPHDIQALARHRAEFADRRPDQADSGFRLFVRLQNMTRFLAPHLRWLISYDEYVVVAREGYLLADVRLPSSSAYTFLTKHFVQESALGCWRLVNDNLILTVHRPWHGSLAPRAGSYLFHAYHERVKWAKLSWQWPSTRRRITGPICHVVPESWREGDPVDPM